MRHGPNAVVAGLDGNGLLFRADLNLPTNPEDFKTRLRHPVLRGTPFHRRTSALCQSNDWRRWGGCIAASSYELTHDREYYAIRSAAGLIDISPLHKYLITGRDAGRFLDRIVTRNVAQCEVNQVLYTPWCDERGKVMDDGTLTRLDDDSYRLTSAEPNYRWLHQNASGFDVTIEDITEKYAALALQGPTSRDILTSIVDADIGSLGFFRSISAHIGDIPVTISRTGYTGDLGFEIWADAGNAEALWDTVMQAGTGHGITPAGLLALDLVRIEAGLILIDVDYVPAHRALIESRTSSPYELGLGWTVKLGNGHFVGSDALETEKRNGPTWELRGLEIDWENLEEVYGTVGLPPQLPSIAWRVSVPVYSGRIQVGYATSGCWSPILKKYIALAHLKRSYIVSGTKLEIEVTVEHHRERATAFVCDTPFFNPERKRA